jgi:hypothetical protein
MDLSYEAALLRAYETVDRLEAIHHEHIPSDERLFSRYRAGITEWRSDILWPGLAYDGFRKTFVDKLMNEAAMPWLQQTLKHANSYQEVYVSHHHHYQLALQENERINWSRRSILSLAQHHRLPQPYLQAYLDKVDADERKIKEIQRFLTGQFRLNSITNHMFTSMLDLKASIAGGTPVLKYEQLAWDVLKTAHRARGRDSIEEVLKRWQLSPGEFQFMNLTKKERLKRRLSRLATRRWFQLLLRRAGLHRHYSVVTRKHLASIRVDGRRKRIELPSWRRLRAEEMEYIGPHEIWHVGRGYNGKHQGCRLWELGMRDYLVTEEGAAGLIEMFYGRSFNHERQTIIAARYLAVAMAMKVRKTTATTEAAHAYEDIFRVLTSHGISQRSAAQIVWRVARGTSLLRQVIPKEIQVNNEQVTLHMAEAHIKDRVYFEGQIDLWRYLFGGVPTELGAFDELFGKAKTLVGRFINVLGKGKVPLSVFYRNSQWRDYIVDRRPFSIGDLKRPWDA